MDRKFPSTIVSGKYLAKLNEKDSLYRARKDGRKELVKITDKRRTVKIVKDLRDEINL